VVRSMSTHTCTRHRKHGDAKLSRSRPASNGTQPRSLTDEKWLARGRSRLGWAHQCRAAPLQHLHQRVEGRLAVQAAAPVAEVLRQLQEVRRLSGRFHPQFRDKNRRDIGKSQSKLTDSKMETPGSPRSTRRSASDPASEPCPRAAPATLVEHSSGCHV
jgi:hypothetical protein